jgi:branched-chain amino acid transport system permease protein
MRANRETVLCRAVMLALALVPPVTAYLHQPFYADVLARIMIFAIAAVSLNFILGFGGMVSFGHAAFLGLGAYVVGLSLANGLDNGFAHLALVVAVSAATAFVIGAICLRTSGLYFIMITLALAQLLYFLGVGLKQYGGDDGFTFRGRSNFGAWLPLGNDVVLYYVIWAVLALSLFLIGRFVEARFGMALRGTRSNERRMRSLGLPTYRYKLAAFVIAGILCAVAGALLANLTQFVSPAYMHWTRSGELLIMVIMGGMGSVFGPVLGAALYLLLEEVLSSFTEHWQVILGPILVLLVFFARGGLAQLWRTERPARGAHHG